MWNFIKRHKESSTLIGLCLISLLTMWFSGRTVLSGPMEIGIQIGAFFQNIATNISNGVGGAFDSMSDFNTLQAKYNDLQTNYKVLENKTADLELIKNENARLKQELEFKQKLEFKSISAEVVAKAPGLYFPNITINKGFNDGITAGMPVIAYLDGEKALVGKIESVTPSYSVVLPLFNENVFVSARLEQSRFEGMVKGMGFSTDPLLMQYVDLDAGKVIKIGELVVSSGVNSRYPSGLPIGRVEAINSRAYENSIELELSPIIPLTRVESVYIIQVPESETKK